MKKWIGYLMIGLLTAGTASAAWWPFDQDKKETSAQEEAVAPRQKAPKQHKQRREGASQQKRHKLTPEQQKNRQAIMRLGKTARNETDPAKKEVLVGELRVKLNEAADKMHAMHQKRIEKAEKSIEKLKQRMAEAEKNRGPRIEEQIQKILSGEPPHRPEGKGKQGKRPEGAKGKKRLQPPVE